MKKSDVKKLKKGQIVYCGGYEWKFHSAAPYVRDIGSESERLLEEGKPDGYKLWLKAIDGRWYPKAGTYQPKLPILINQYWLGICVDYKKADLNIRL